MVIPPRSRRQLIVLLREAVSIFGNLLTIESESREYIREEHLPMLSTRFRTFETYHASRNETAFMQYVRLTIPEFEDLHSKIADLLTYEVTHRAPINSRQRLCLFLRWAAHGYSFRALSAEYSCGKSTCANIILDVSQAINTRLMSDAFPTPTAQSFADSARKFQQRYDYPRCVGCLDGKHICIRKPNGSGSHYFNYKGFFSVVLMAMCDADYRIILFDIGSPGRNSDGGVFASSGMKKFLDDNDHLFPPTEPLGAHGDVTYHVLVDGGFGVTKRFVRPFTGPQSATCRKKRHFNQKLSGARRIIESVFGILCRRFTILTKPMQLPPDRCSQIVVTLMILHNMLALRSDALAYSNRYPAVQRGGLVAQAPAQRGNQATQAKVNRDRIVDYYSVRDNIV